MNQIEYWDLTHQTQPEFTRLGMAYLKSNLMAWELELLDDEVADFYSDCDWLHA